MQVAGAAELLCFKWKSAFCEPHMADSTKSLTSGCTTLVMLHLARLWPHIIERSSIFPEGTLLENVVANYMGDIHTIFEAHISVMLQGKE